MDVMGMLLGGIPPEIRLLGEEAIARYIVDQNREEIVEAYDRARAAGATEQGAALAGARRMITHTL